MPTALVILLFAILAAAGFGLMFALVRRPAIVAAVVGIAMLALGLALTVSSPPLRVTSPRRGAPDVRTSAGVRSPSPAAPEAPDIPEPPGARGPGMGLPPPLPPEMPPPALAVPRAQETGAVPLVEPGAEDGLRIVRRKDGVTVELDGKVLSSERIGRAARDAATDAKREARQRLERQLTRWREQAPIELQELPWPASWPTWGCGWNRTRPPPDRIRMTGVTTGDSSCRRNSCSARPASGRSSTAVSGRCRARYRPRLPRPGWCWSLRWYCGPARGACARADDAGRGRRFFPPSATRATLPRVMRKNYVLDANVLLHDPQCIFHFADNTVLIPVGVIAEIDRFKKEMTARGYNAREVVRVLDGLRNGESLATGIPLASGGMLRVYCEKGRAPGTHPGAADEEILRVAQLMREQEPAVPVVIVTKDMNLRVRADAAGLRAENYESDKLRLSELYAGHREREMPAELLERLRHDGHVDLPGETLAPNEYLLLRTADGSRGTLLARVNPAATGLQLLREADDGLAGIKPRNKEQYFAIDGLLDDQLQLVTLMGKAGTGKTLLAIAAALHMTLRKKRYRNVLIARPIIPVGRDLGYLPGDVENKLAPWLKPVTDTIEYLFDTGGPIKGMRDCASLIRTGLIEIQPLTYIRGRSIERRYVVIDEAQNLTPLEVKTIITRIGQDAKVVLTGDVYQIDNPYVDAESNGFTHLVNAFRGQSVAAHVELRKGERSSLAELAANLL